MLETFSPKRYSCLQSAEGAANALSPRLHHTAMFFLLPDVSAWSSSAQQEQARLPRSSHPSPMRKCQINPIKPSFFPLKSPISLQKSGLHDTRAQLSPCQVTGSLYLGRRNGFLSARLLPPRILLLCVKIPLAIKGFNAAMSTENIMHLPQCINHIPSYINYAGGFSLVLCRPLGAMDYFQQENEDE